MRFLSIRRPIDKQRSEVQQCMQPSSENVCDILASVVTKSVLQWFQSYLSVTYQSTSVNNASPSPSQLMYGVPRGSVLGPIFFVLYTTPLSDIIANHSVNHQLFADDTQLQKFVPLTKELNTCTDNRNPPQFLSLIRLFLALTTSPSLILPGALDSFLTQN